MGLRHLILHAVMLAMLAGPYRCACGIRTTAAADCTAAVSACCSCCDVPCDVADRSSAKGAVCEAGAGAGAGAQAGEESCSAAENDRLPDAPGCPARGKPRQAWDVGSDGFGAKFKLGPAFLPVVGMPCVHATLQPSPGRGRNQSVDERAVIWGRDLLLLLQILRC